MERKVDEAAESCPQYHTALFREPGRRHLGSLGQRNLIQKAQRHGIHSLSPRRASPLQVKTGTKDSPYPQQPLLNSPNLPHVLMPTTLQPAL